MDGVAATVHFVHLASGAAWLGGSLFANLFLVPFVLRQPVDRQRHFTGALLLGPERLMIGAALLVVVTGLGRGILFGPIVTLEALGQPYGLVWLLSLTIVALVFVTGARLTGPAIHRLTREDDLWSRQCEADERRRESLAHRLVIGFRAELLGIFVVLGLMVVLSSL
jgi:putative copper export protein